MKSYSFLDIDGVGEEAPDLDEQGFEGHDEYIPLCTEHELIFLKWVEDNELEGWMDWQFPGWWERR